MPSGLLRPLQGPCLSSFMPGCSVTSRYPSHVSLPGYLTNKSKHRPHTHTDDLAPPLFRAALVFLKPLHTHIGTSP